MIHKLKTIIDLKVCSTQSCSNDALGRFFMIPNNLIIKPLLKSYLTWFLSNLVNFVRFSSAKFMSKLTCAFNHSSVKIG